MELIERATLGACDAGHDGGRAVDYAPVERELGERTAAIERAAHHTILAGLHIDAPLVRIEGRTYTRVRRAEGRTTRWPATWSSPARCIAPSGTARWST